MAATVDAQAERRARDRELAEQAVAALESSEGWQAWLRARRAFRSYSLHNQLLIALQNPDATRVAGFKAWLKLGYCVRKGEKALRIWAPAPPTKKQREQAKAEGREDELRTYFRLVPVFDVAQVDPLPPPAEPAILEPPGQEIDGDQLAHLLYADGPLWALATELGVTVEFKDPDGEAGGYFAPSLKRVVVYTGRPINQQAKTLIHELAHAIHHIELGNIESYEQGELIAECVAFTVCHGLGLDTSAYSIPYLAGWKDSPDGLKGVADHIDRIAKRIEDALQPEEP